MELVIDVGFRTLKVKKGKEFFALLSHVAVSVPNMNVMKTVMQPFVTCARRFLTASTNLETDSFARCR
jgi:hypothetical protein